MSSSHDPPPPDPDSTTKQSEERLQDQHPAEPMAEEKQLKEEGEGQPAAVAKNTPTPPKSPSEEDVSSFHSAEEDETTVTVLTDGIGKIELPTSADDAAREEQQPPPTPNEAEKALEIGNTEVGSKSEIAEKQQTGFVMKDELPEVTGPKDQGY